MEEEEEEEDPWSVFRSKAASARTGRTDVQQHIGQYQLVLTLRLSHLTHASIQWRFWFGNSGGAHAGKYYNAIQKYHILLPSQQKQ